MYAEKIIICVIDQKISKYTVGYNFSFIMWLKKKGKENRTTYPADTASSGRAEVHISGRKEIQHKLF